jgi:transglutaminase-like putative cysteine protease
VQLDYTDSTDDTLRSRFIHRRIKILNDQGKRYGDVVIPVPQGYTISDIKARTILPNGRAVEFKDRIFEKVILRRSPEKLIARTFSLRDVRVGSIVEVKYRLLWEKYVYDTTWSLQHDLYTLRERFWLRPYQGTLETRHGGDETRLSYVYSNIPAGVTPRETGAGIELKLENVEAFAPEAMMPPEENFKPEVRFFYGGREMESPDTFWRDIGRDWYEKSERFMGRRRELETAAAEIIGAEADARQKLRKIYARLQLLRNLSYEPARSAARARKEDLKSNDNAGQVLSRGYGYQSEIAELFTALARAAGFEAELLRASSRETRVFDEKLLSENQLAWEIVRVKMGADYLFLDPGTRFCPFGMVAWQHTSVPALKLDRQGGEFVVVPTPRAEQTITRRTAEMQLSPEGALQGEITLEFRGNEALQRRLDALDTDEAGQRREMEDQLLNWLPAGARVRWSGAQGWDSSEEPLVIHFHAEVPGFASAPGRSLLFRAGLFSSSPAGLFVSDERKFPIYFPYTFQEIDRIAIRLPQGYKIHSLPDGEEIRLPAALFLATWSQDGGDLKLTKALVVNSIYFQPEQYSSLRDFFSRAEAVDRERILLQR